MIKRSTKKAKIIFSITNGILLLEIIAYIVCFFAGAFDANRHLMTLFVILLPLACSGVFITLLAIAIRDRFYKSAKEENAYLLGDETCFYNPVLLRQRVAYLKRKNHNSERKQFLIAYTPSKYDANTPMYRNSPVRELNKFVAREIKQMFFGDSIINEKQVAYCFYQSLFLIYIFGSLEDVELIMQQLRERTYKVAEKENIKTYISPRFGVAEVHLESLYSTVDNAVFARSYADNTFEDVIFYSPSLRKEATFDEIDKIQKGIENKEFEVYYQPKYSLSEKRFVSTEALIRWNSPEGVIPAAEFIEKAEIGGLIHILDNFVFDSVLKKLSDDKAKNRRLIPVSVNFSLYEFYNPNFVQNIADKINAADLNPELIEIEISEKTSLSNVFMATRILKKLRDLGIKITMDDFGSGYSSISSLNQMPFNVVKIDRAIVSELGSSKKTEETVRAIISLAKANEQTVIAQGVESFETVELLKKLKCDMIQGYYYTKPLKAENYDKFLIENTFETKEAKKL